LRGGGGGGGCAVAVLGGRGTGRSRLPAQPPPPPTNSRCPARAARLPCRARLIVAVGLGRRRAGREVCNLCAEQRVGTGNRRRRASARARGPAGFGASAALGPRGSEGSLASRPGLPHRYQLNISISHPNPCLKRQSCSVWYPLPCAPDRQLVSRARGDPRHRTLVPVAGSSSRTGGSIPASLPFRLQPTLAAAAALLLAAQALLLASQALCLSAAGRPVCGCGRVAFRGGVGARRRPHPTYWSCANSRSASRCLRSASSCLRSASRCRRPPPPPASCLRRRCRSRPVDRRGTPAGGKARIALGGLVGALRPACMRQAARRAGGRPLARSAHGANLHAC
jgi:hypothetical protein